MTLWRCEETGHGGWSVACCSDRDEVELWISLEVGPRILRLQRRGGKIFYEDGNAVFIGQSGEPSFRLRRTSLWTAPESTQTYEADNHAVSLSEVSGHRVELLAPLFLACVKRWSSKR